MKVKHDHGYVSLESPINEELFKTALKLSHPEDQWILVGWMMAMGFDLDVISESPIWVRCYYIAAVDQAGYLAQQKKG